VGGVLLYPLIDQDFDFRYEILGHPVRALSADLCESWPRIHKRLLDVAGTTLTLVIHHKGLPCRTALGCVGWSSRGFLILKVFRFFLNRSMSTYRRACKAVHIGRLQWTETTAAQGVEALVRGTHRVRARAIGFAARVRNWRFRLERRGT